MNNNYIDMMMTNTITWFNKMIDFIMQFKFIFAVGIGAMMLSKAFKFKLNLGGKGK